MRWRTLISVLLAALSVALVVEPQAAFAQEPKPETEQPDGFQDSLNSGLKAFNGVVVDLLFFSVTGSAFDTPEVDALGKPVFDAETGERKIKKVGFPFIVAVLVAGGIFYSFFYRWISLRGFRHAINVVRGKFDDPEDDGEISHFRALTSALSATVGLGNIAGVAIAISIGGPGAVLWMMIAALFGMCLKFHSCTLSQMFRRTNADGSVSGGPMYYLDVGLSRIGGAGSPIAWVGKVLAVMYALMIMGGSFGGGNMFQSNQAFVALQTSFGVADSAAHAFGVVLAVLVGLVILGGIQRIGAATSKIVPTMVVLYIIASLFILLTNIEALPGAIGTIFSSAFSDNALQGGVLGVMVTGFQRASFSNEAGIGSAAVAHAAAKTKWPVREGMVAMLGPVIDTVIVCVMTASVVIVTGVWQDPELVGKVSGVELTAAAFGKGISWFPTVLSVSVLLFAYSTMVSWAYYGERGWIYLIDLIKQGAGQKSLVVYRLLFVFFVYVGAVSKLEQVLTFSDLMILCMAFPNVVGGILLAPKVKQALTEYWGKYRRGEFDAHSPAVVTDK